MKKGRAARPGQTTASEFGKRREVFPGTSKTAKGKRNGIINLSHFEGRRRGKRRQTVLLLLHTGRGGKISRALGSRFQKKEQK